MFGISRPRVVEEKLQFASDGPGPLLQRDYWAVIEKCRLEPTEIIGFLCRRFDQIAPEKLVRFENRGKADRPLSMGDALAVDIRMTPEVRVRVVDISEQSLTLGTVRGHPEAGKITFGAYRNSRGDVIFHIRSRARSRSFLHLVVFLIGGDAMQTNTWCDFIDRLAHSVGDGVIGPINADKQKVQEEPRDSDTTAPTFIARGL